MKALLPEDLNQSPSTAISPFSRKVRSWLAQTPQRALEAAYQAALKIRQIEETHFEGSVIAPQPHRFSQEAYRFFEDDLNRCLTVIQIRLAEFRTGRFLLNQSQPGILDKLKLIDQVCDRYAQLKKQTRIQEQVELMTIAPSSYEAVSLANQPANPVMDKTGALPRSIGQTVDRIKTELMPGSEQQILQQFRASRTRTKIAVRCLILLALAPLLIQIVAKNAIYLPLLHRWEPIETAPLFINSELEEEAFHQLQQFKERLEFEQLLADAPKLSEEEINTKVQQKAETIAEESRIEGQNAIANVLADGTALLGFIAVAWLSRPQIRVLKSFIDGVIYGLSDIAKAFIIILFTDMFVGFHSPHGWEVILENLSKHLGLAPNHDLIFLFIATVPVLLDTMAKYWVFRYLSRSSPSAVATLREMDE